MSISLCNLQPLFISSLHHRQPIVNIRFTTTTTTTAKLRRHSHPISTHTLNNSSFRILSPPKSASVNEFSVQNSPEKKFEKGNAESNNLEFLVKFRRLIAFLKTILPGGSWWNLSKDVQVAYAAKPVTVWRALGRMWELVSRDRWVIFAAFSALILTALSEISIPHFLTASIFSAQNGEVMVFHRNVRLMVLLCITSGICRSKSCMVKAPFSYLKPVAKLLFLLKNLKVHLKTIK